MVASGPSGLVLLSGCHHTGSWLVCTVAPILPKAWLRGSLYMGRPGEGHRLGAPVAGLPMLK